MGFIERRSSERMEIKLSCLVCLPLRGTHYLAGATEEISRGGMQLRITEPGVTPQELRPGEPVRILVELPSSQAAPPKCLQCEGIVARVGEPDLNPGCVALRIWRMEFRDRSEIFDASGPPPSDCKTGSYLN